MPGSWRRQLERSSCRHPQRARHRRTRDRPDIPDPAGLASRCHPGRQRSSLSFHAVADEVLPFRLIAEAIGRQFGMPSRSLALVEAEAHFGGLASWVAGNGPASREQTQAALGWTPTQTDLVSDIDQPAYYS